jgi:pentatricopeptide repeat protein
VLAECHPFVTDFGLARRMEGDGNRTQSGAVVGTPSYMAPEQARSEKGLTTAADVYSLGAVLYELLAGRPPFRGDNMMDVLLQVVERDPPSPQSLNPHLNRDLATICMRCLEKAPARRYSSAEAVAEDLERWLDGKPIRARPGTRLERAAKWVRRRPAAAALLAVSLLAGIAILLLGSLLYRQTLEQSRAEARRQAEEADSQRRQREEKAQELARTREALATAQLWRAAGLWRRDPRQALALLEDTSACPDQTRDFAWRYYHRLASSEHGVWPAHEETTALALSRDGTLLASAGTEGKVKLWEPLTGKLLRALDAHDGGAYAVGFTPDGTTLVSGGKDGLLKVWNVADGTLRNTWKGHQSGGWIMGLAVSPDGKALFTVASTRNLPESNSQRWKLSELRRWDLATGTSQLLGRFPQGVICVAVSPDGRFVAAGEAHGSQAHVWDLHNPEQHARTDLIGSGGGWIQAMTFSPDSRTLAVGRADHLVHLCDVQPSDETSSLRVFARTLFRGHLSQVEGVAFTPDGARLASAGLMTDQSVRLWDVASGTELSVLTAPPQHQGYYNPTHAVVFTPDGRFLLQGHGQNIRRWRVPGPLEAVRFNHRQVRLLAVSADGKRVASAGSENGLKVWEVATGRLLGNRRRPSPLQSVAFDRAGRVLAAASQQQTLQLWLDAEQSPAAEVALPAPLLAVAFSPDAMLLIGSTRAPPGGDGRPTWHLHRWEVREDGKKLTAHPALPVPLDEGTPSRLLAGRDGLILILTSAHELLRLDTDTGKAARWLSRVHRVALSPDGSRLAVHHGDEITVHDLTGTTPPVVLDGQGTLAGPLAVSVDGRTVAAGSDRGVRIWDTRSGRLRALLQGHSREVKALTFTPDDWTLISASGYEGRDTWVRGGEVLLWQTNPAATADVDQPVEPEIWKVRARMYQARAEWDRSRVEMAEAVRVHPGEQDLWHELVQVELRLDRFADAANHVDAALQEHPEGASLVAHVGATAYLLAGREDDHRKLCEALVKAHFASRNANLLHTIARTCSVHDLPAPLAAQALDMARRSVDGSPNVGWVRRTMATCCMRAGRPDEAIQIHSEMIEKLRPSSSIPLHWLPLALAHHKAGRPEKAREYLDLTTRRVEEWKRSQPADQLTPAGMHPNDWLEFLALYREARATVTK